MNAVLLRLSRALQSPGDPTGSDAVLGCGGWWKRQWRSEFLTSPQAMSPLLLQDTFCVPKD